MIWKTRQQKINEITAKVIAQAFLSGYDARDNVDLKKAIESKGIEGVAKTYAHLVVYYTNNSDKEHITKLVA